MVYDSRRNRRPNRRAPRDSGVELDHEGKPLYRDYGHGFSAEGRPITGIADGDILDPSAPIDEPKGEVFNIGVKRLSDLPAKPSMTPCQPDQHVFEPEGNVGDEIPGHQSMKCRYCPVGQLVPAAG